MSATLDLPPADNSAMDGYAIRHADYRPDVVLPIQQRCYAGDMPQPQLPGQATRLFTGSLIPPGADTVVIQENTREADGRSEEHTSELQSLMRSSYAVFCLKKKKKKNIQTLTHTKT